jgi:alkaline phosphatase D
MATPGAMEAASADEPAAVDESAVTHGPICGEVTADSMVLWARGNGPGTLVFEVAAAGTETFAEILQTATVTVDAAHDFTGEVRVTGLESGQAYDYRVILQSGAAEPGCDCASVAGAAEQEVQVSEAVLGVCHTAPAADAPAAFSFTFSAGMGGQGYCRNPETGWVIFETMLAQDPDFFILTGDSVYVDSACPAPPNVPGAEGPYSDLAGFRTRYRYHLEDAHYAALLAATPVYVTWDDHEILDNFGGPAMQAINPQLFEEGRQAYFDYWPLMGTEEDPYRIYRQVSYGALADFFILDTRSYRDPNVNWDPHPRTTEPKTMLGAEQFAWLQAGLEASTATWTFIVTSVPLAYPTGWPQPEVDGRDGWADFKERSGFETELLSLVYFIESHDLQNVVFLAGDTHWPFAISYDPDRDGAPNFYELGASPMSSIPLAPPAELDPTFNPTVIYAEGEFQGDLFNFGHVTVAEDGAMTFRVIDWTGGERYALTLMPE